MSSVPPISGYGQTNPIHRVGAKPTGNENVKKTDGPNLFEGFLQSTNLDQKSSDQAIQDLVDRKTDSVQDVVMAVAKAEMSFQLFMEIRNSLIDSYNELMRMQF